MTPEELQWLLGKSQTPNQHLEKIKHGEREALSTAIMEYHPTLMTY